MHLTKRHRPAGTPTIFALAAMRLQGDIGPFTTWTSKRQGVVILLKAPPDKPPSRLQFARRQAMRAAAINWNALSSVSRSSWRRACIYAQLRITPFALFFYFLDKRDHAVIDTIRRITREPMTLV
jgi:hypothetical protein